MRTQTKFVKMCSILPEIPINSMWPCHHFKRYYAIVAQWTNRNKPKNTSIKDALLFFLATTRSDGAPLSSGPLSGRLFDFPLSNEKKNKKEKTKFSKVMFYFASNAYLPHVVVPSFHKMVCHVSCSITVNTTNKQQRNKNTFIKDTDRKNKLYQAQPLEV